MGLPEFGHRRLTHYGTGSLAGVPSIQCGSKLLQLPCRTSSPTRLSLRFVWPETCSTRFLGCSLVRRCRQRSARPVGGWWRRYLRRPPRAEREFCSERTAHTHAYCTRRRRRRVDRSPSPHHASLFPSLAQRLSVALLPAGCVRFHVLRPLGRHRSGCGLGLAIVHQIVTQHQGTMSARNNDDRGMTFSVRLPLERRKVA